MKRSIQAACSDVIATPEAINGFGLLKAVKYFRKLKATTFNFLYLTIQGYLSVNYIITELQPDEELHLLHNQFWSDIHMNMFSIYIALTKGQKSAFKKFLSGRKKKLVISSEFLCDPLIILNVSNYSAGSMVHKSLNCLYLLKK